VRTPCRIALVRLVASVLCVALIAGATTPAIGAPATSAISAKRKQANAAREKLDDLQTALEMRYEEHAQIEASLAQTRQRISITRKQLDQASAELAGAQSRLEERAISIYRTGSIDMVSVFVGASDFSDFLSLFDLMRRISRSDAALVSAVKEARGRVETAETALETREAEQVELRQEARVKQQQFEDAYRRQETYVASLKSELKKLIEAERVRQEKIAAAKIAEAQRKLRSVKNGTTSSGGSFDVGTLGAAHPEVVAVAKKYLGVPYVWGGTTPAGFDCSGLCQYSYRKIGINLPRTSREQFHAGVNIPPDRLDLLDKGDLVFFGYDGDSGKIHHVGIYVGGGDFIEAPAAGMDVRISSLTGRIADRRDYVGAARP
jgi:peptidoglycan DL-endopeptidase CwlO